MMIKSKMIIFAAVLTIALALGGCTKPPTENGEKDMPIEGGLQIQREEAGAYDFQTVASENGDAMYEIPDNWEKREDFSTENESLYVMKGVDISTKPSNITVEVQKNGTIYPKGKDAEETFFLARNEQIPQQIPGASNFQNKVYKTSYGDVYVISYDRVIEGGKTVTQTQYCPNLDGYLIVVYTTDFGEGTTPDLHEAAKKVIDTLKLK